MKRKKFKHVPESMFDDVAKALFKIECALPDSPQKSRLYKLRCDLGVCQLANRIDKDKIQHDWVVADNKINKKGKT